MNAILEDSAVVPAARRIAQEDAISCLFLSLPSNAENLFKKDFSSRAEYRVLAARL